MILRRLMKRNSNGPVGFSNWSPLRNPVAKVFCNQELGELSNWPEPALLLDSANGAKEADVTRLRDERDALQRRLQAIASVGAVRGRSPLNCKTVPPLSAWRRPK